MEKDRQQETRISKFLAKESAWDVAQCAGEYSVINVPYNYYPVLGATHYKIM